MNTPASPASVSGSNGAVSAQRIAELEAQVLALRAEMQSLSATLSHDLRAPLRHITSFAQLVQVEAGPQLNDEMREFLDNISGSAKTLGSMLDGLLALSRIGTVVLHPESVDLAALVQALVQERQAALRAQAPGRTVLWSVDVSALPAVQADAELLRQALGHVLDNAIQFTGPQAQATIGVSACVDAATGQLHCSVQDNGVGFALEQAAKLFRPFVRLHSGSQFPGLGMGLALVRKTMQRIGGDASISATVQGGCRVVLRLPLA